MLNYIDHALSHDLSVTLHLSTGQSLDIRTITNKNDGNVECESSSSSSKYLLRLSAVVFVETNHII